MAGLLTCRLRRLCVPFSSQPQAHIPSGPVERTYDIKYYPRDSRRNPWNHVAPEATFFQIDTDAHLSKTPQVEEPKRGSPGNKVRTHALAGTRVCLPPPMLTLWMVWLTCRTRT